MDIGIFDGQWILRRNALAAFNNDIPTYSSLITSFLQSINKFCNDYGIEYSIILFDRSPYLKSMKVEMKTDRYYPKVADTKAITPDMSAADIEKVMEDNRRLTNRLLLEEAIRSAKYTMIRELSNYGLSILAFKGYEADDLAYYLTHKFDLGSNIHFITLDSDWEYLMTENVIFHRIQKIRTDIKWSNDTNIPKHILGIIKEITIGNHNGIQKISKSYDEIIANYPKLDPDILEIIKTLDPETYWNDDIKNYMISRLESKALPSRDQIYQFFSQHGIRMKLDKFENLTRYSTFKVNYIEEL